MTKNSRASRALAWLVAATCALSATPSSADFILNNSALPSTKTDLIPLRIGASPTNYFMASDFNALMQGLLDTRLALTFGSYWGLAAQASDPNARTTYANTNYFWYRNNSTLHFHDGVGDKLLSFIGGTAVLTDASTVNTDASVCNCNVFTVTLAGNRTLANPTNLVAGGTYMWIVTQDASGSRTLAYGSNFKWPAGAAPTLTTAANSVDLITAVYDGTKLRAVFTGDLR